MFLLLAITLLFCAAVDAQSSQNCKAKQKESWSYGGENGPKNWYKNYPDCAEKEQSPIKLSLDDAKRANAPGLGYKGYNQRIKGIIKNNGHAVQVDPKDDVERGITVDNTFYALQQLHFHFGSSSVGSEHRMNGQDYVMEMHLVHKNKDDQLAVLGLFFEETSQANDNLNDLIEEVKRVRYYGDSVELENPLNLTAFAVPCVNTYYRYAGSLTTPPCSQGVKWLVLKRHSTIGRDQLTAFRDQYSTKKSEPKGEECMLQNNYRPIQPINDRTVTLYNEQCR